MAKAKRTKSGSWTILVYDYTDEKDKKHYKRFTKPTKAEVEYLAKEYELNRENLIRTDKTVRDAVNEYINSRRATRSPSTIIGYEGYAENRFQEFLKVPVQSVQSHSFRQF